MAESRERTPMLYVPDLNSLSKLYKHTILSFHLRRLLNMHKIAVRIMREGIRHEASHPAAAVRLRRMQMIPWYLQVVTNDLRI